MVESIKPIEGNVKDSGGQSAVLAEVVRTRYWKQLAQQRMPPVEESEESAGSNVDDEKRNRPIDEKLEQSSFRRRTYAEFEINQETHEVQVRIFDAESGQIVRTIPPDELAKEIAKGNLLPNQLRRRAVFV